MITDNPEELRTSASYFRDIAENGSDLHLKLALVQLAKEFDQEAESLEARLTSQASNDTDG